MTPMHDLPRAETRAPDSPTPTSPGQAALCGDRALSVLQQLPAWGDLVTIVLHGGCVFEFKGPFPTGVVHRGFYNLQGSRPGFEGHLKLEAIDHIGFQDRPHGGRMAHALTFNDRDGANIFKVFLGRDDRGEIWPEQLRAYETLRAEAREGEICP